MAHRCWLNSGVSEEVAAPIFRVLTTYTLEIDAAGCSETSVNIYHAIHLFPTRLEFSYVSLFAKTRVLCHIFSKSIETCGDMNGGLTHELRTATSLHTQPPTQGVL
jgi:hypothetical protein